MRLTMTLIFARVPSRYCQSMVTDNNITAYASKADAAATAQSGTKQFASEKEFAQLAGKWPMTRLVEIWNTLAGVVPVKKFTNRTKAVTRIWEAVQGLAPTAGPSQAGTATTAKRSRRKKATPATEQALS